ncbi:MAG: DUF4838 domain-containing protein [Tyzzerella sp.]|nr:DUF4838 domain-containing protein [Tyzzerella sp.]
MKKRKIRLCAGLLAAIMTLSGCSGSGGATTTPIDPVEITETHYLTNTLHKVTVKESNRAFIVDGVSEYKIIAGKDESTQTAASYLVSYLRKATGCSLEFAEPEAYSADGKYIVMNVPDLFASAGLTMPEDDLGVTGYYIKTVNDNVFLTSNYENGARFAMLAFLRQVVGFKMYALDAVSFEKDGKTLPDMDIVEAPDIPYFRRMHNQSDEKEESYMMGFVEGGFVSYQGRPWHNSLTYLPMETYQKEHPKWYSTIGNDLCYTAHGDEKELEAMTTIIANEMLKTAAEQPEALFSAITIMDHAQVCLCDACRESAAKYNGSDAAAVVKFTNKINEKVQAELQRQADEKGTKKRPLTVMFFAYYAMTQPPVIKNEDGTFSPIDETVVCDENVAVFYAPIMADYNCTFYDEVNQQYYDAIKGWSACSEEIFCWLYETNFEYYLFPYNCWDARFETYRLCVESGAPFIMSQGQHNANASTGFSDFKDYMNSCAIFDLNQNYEDVMNDYFTNYYLDAAEPMLQYFDELRAWMYHLERTYSAEISGYCKTEIGKDKFWPKNLLMHWLNLIDEAYEAAETYKDDKALYMNLINRIKKESMFPRYALIEFYSGTFSVDTLESMKYSFKADAQELLFDRHAESFTDGEISAVYERWGIK